MLIKDVNDNPEEIKKISNFLSELNPKTSYISIPIRPPAEKWVNPVDEAHINTAFQIISENVENCELLVGYEGDSFTFTGDVEEDLLSITSVHPMRKDSVMEFLKKSNSSWDILEKLISQNKVVELKYQNNLFYLRKFPLKT